MVHMPGHIFFRLGDYASAEQAFAASLKVDERYMREQHVQPDNDWNYVHNLMYAIANLMEEGKLEEATGLSAKLTDARGELESTLYVYSTRDSISRLNPRLPVALRTADWAQVLALLKASTPRAPLPNLRFLARELTDFAAGMRAVAAHDVPQAEEFSLRLDAALWRMSPHANTPPLRQATEAGPPKLEVMPDALLQPLLRSLSILSLELRASLLTAQRKTDEAKGLFAKAAQEEKDLGYREPPSYIRPVREAEGAAMLAIGEWTPARAAYQKALLERPRSGLALYGVALSSEKSGDSKTAARDYTDFLAAWKNADPGLAQLVHAHAYVAAHPVRGAMITAEPSTSEK
jgi:tetratricopeptide (TPR) repeat protein